ncbi:CDGSH iron-sulfur domain-containing protein [Streptomyces sp. NPDC048197]|uniref:CDGSH iron-sulfur domain-containing protein n=1 Tax=Streptomyces sp. NPDC048197 TaxID=3365511 RepID=UPI00370FD4FC
MTLTRDGPMLVEGPVEVVCDDGSVAVSDRFVVALCTCRRSHSYPWCDTSHRRRARPTPEPGPTHEPGSTPESDPTPESGPTPEREGDAP